MDAYITLPVPMRATPSFSWTGGLIIDPGAVSVTALAMYSIVANQYVALAPTAASSIAQSAIQLVQNATNSVALSFSSEL
jgi:hypothetical protein